MSPSPFLDAKACPAATITNGLIRATLWMPDATRGFYRSTRFDWSGVVAALQCAGHDFYAPWFTHTEPGIRDFIFRGSEIVASLETAMVGPAEEFPTPQGYEAAGAGGLFLKLGVGILRRPDSARYSPFSPYELVDTGTWTTEAEVDAVTFTHEVGGPADPHAYVYRKTVRLAPREPVMRIEHALTNVGRMPIETTQYNHNFLTLDGATTGPDLTVTAAFPIVCSQPPNPALAMIAGSQVRFVRPLTGAERVSLPIEGFSVLAADHGFRIDHHASGVGVHMTADRPLVRAHLWAIRSVVAVEPFVDVSTQPGATTHWSRTYRYAAAADESGSAAPRLPLGASNRESR